MEDGRWRPFTRRSGKSVRPAIVVLPAFKYRRTPETMHRTCWLTYLMMVAVAVGST